MKRLLLSIATAAAVSTAFAFPQAIYVKQGDIVTKYNFGVASDLNFSNNGKTLSITGYKEVIDLDKIDYISFSAPNSGTALTPSEQKQKLVTIGEEAYSKIDMNRYADIFNMIHVFFDDTRDGNGHWVDAPVSYWIDPKYYDVHNAVKAMLQSTSQMMKGNAAAPRAFKAKAVDLYKVSDYFGVFTANRDSEKWEKTSDADYLEIRFNSVDGTDYSVRLTASEDFTTWNTVDFNGQLPRTMTVTFSKGSEELAKATIKSELVQDHNIKIALDFQAYNLAVNNTMNVVNNNLSDDVTITIDGKPYVTADTDISGHNLVNYDSMYSAIKESMHYHDENDECCGEDPHELLAHFVRATSNIDVLGKLQVKANVAGLTKIYDALAEDNYVFDRITIDGNKEVYVYGKVLSQKDGIIDISHEDSNVNEKHIQYLNNYVDATFYYDGTNQAQGYITWDLNEETEENYQWIDDCSGYTIVDGMLIWVRRDSRYDYDYEKNEEFVTYGDWYYNADLKKGDDEWEYIQVTVDPKDVIQPEIIRNYYYGDMPVLVFPDMTSFSFEDFFDEDSFQKLIDDYNDIIDTYLNITGQERDDDDYWY